MVESLLRYFSDVCKAVGVALFVYSYFAFTFGTSFHEHRMSYYGTFLLGSSLVMLGGYFTVLAVKLSERSTKTTKQPTKPPAKKSRKRKGAK